MHGSFLFCAFIDFDLTWIIDSFRFDCPSTNQSTDRVACWINNDKKKLGDTKKGNI